MMNNETPPPDNPQPPSPNTERWKLEVRSCYCSIFNDCWITKGMQGLPKAVKSCPQNWTPYREDAGRRIAS